MERDFEQEVKEWKQSEIPDLWNRIEAGLSEKKETACPVKNTDCSESADSYGRADARETVMISTAISGKKADTGRKTAWRKWAVIAAACLCIVISLPAAAMLTGSFGRQENSDSGAAELASDAVMPEEFFAADMTEEEDMAEGGAAAGAPLTDSVSETADASKEMETEAAADESVSGTPEDTNRMEDKTTGASMEREESAADISSAASADGISEEETEEQKEFGDWSAYGLTDGQILQGIIVHVLETRKSGEETIYTVIILQTDEEAVLEEYAEIQITGNSGTEYSFLRGPREEKVLKKGENYEVSLCYEADGQEESGLGRLVVVTAQ